MARRFFIVFLAWLFPCMALAQSPAAPPDLKRWRTVYQSIMEKNAPKLMVGDLEGYVAAIRSAVKPDDWTSQLVAGDAVYRVSPAHATVFHEAAAKLAPNEGLPQLELALDHHRAGRCDRAIPAWEAADRLGALGSPVTAVAAYCFFRAGRTREAFDLWSRVQWPAHRRSLDSLLSEMVMGTRALDVHIRAYSLARGGDEDALRVLIENALNWRYSFWNADVNREAFDAVRGLAKSVRPSDARLHRELECANEAIAAKDATSLRQLLHGCRFIIDNGELPASSEVAKFLFARVDY